MPEGTTIAEDITEFPASADDKVWLQPAPDRLLAWDIAARLVSTEITGLVPQPETWLKFSLNPESGWLAATPSLPIMQPVPAGWKTSFYTLPTGRLLGQLPAAEFLLAPRGRRALGPGINGWAIVHASGAQLAMVDVRPAGPIDSEWSSAAVFSPDGAQVFVARGDGKIEVFDSDTGVSKRVIPFAQDQKTSVNQLRVDPSCRWALVATHDKSWRIGLTNGRSDEVFANEDRYNQWTFLDGGKLIVGAAGSMIKWWTFPELKPVAQAKVEGTAASVLLGPDRSELLIKTKWEGSLTIVDRNTGSVRMRLSGVIALDPTLRNAALKVPVDGYDSLRIIRLSDGEIIAERFNLSPSSTAFAADGSRVIYEHDKKFVSFALPYEAAALRQRAATLR
ncbi:MAG: WD40 repeat domain-containing protein, partial [Alphaproteobacteria bacterium]